MKNVKNNKIANRGNSILLFSTASCRPCKNMKSILSEFEKIHGSKISFYNIDIESNTSLASKFNIKSVPTTVFINNDKVIDRFAGFIDNIDLEGKMMNLLFNIEDEIGFDLNEF